MTAPVKPLDFTNVKNEPLSQSKVREHRIRMLPRYRLEELALLEKLRAEALMPERYAER